MSALVAQFLPHIGAALLAATLALLASRRFSESTTTASVVTGLVFIGCLIPFTGHPLSHYIRVLCGDLSITGLIVLTAIIWRRLRDNEAPPSAMLLGTAMAIALVSVVFYPTSLGLTFFDLYAYGYAPVVLSPALFVLFAWSLWRGYQLPALILGAGFVAYSLNFLDSDNLWDYVLDPVVAIYAISLVIRHRSALPRPDFSQTNIEWFLGITILTFLIFAVFLSHTNPHAFRYDLVIEDGFVEWCTVIILFVAMVVCGRRFLQLRGRRNALFLSVTGLLTLLCLFGAGEEISWGQRIFGLETPEYLMERNAQGEIGLHNLVIEVNGEEVKLNKLIFGTGLAIMMFIYLAIATPLYRTQPRVRAFFNAIAAPMPRNIHIVGYILVVAIVELLVDSSKRGEMTEFAASIVFALNVIYPYNPEIFDPDKPLPNTTSA